MDKTTECHSSWGDRVDALRSLGLVSSTDWPMPSSNHRAPYRYVTVRKQGSAAEIAAVSGEWILIAARVDGYVTVDVHSSGVQIGMAISRDLTEDEIASYANRISPSFEVAQP